MTTNPTVTTNQAQNWKWVSGILVGVLALILVGVAVESYFFYRMAHQPLPVVPTLAPKLPVPNGPALNPVIPPIDDIALPGTMISGGSPWDQLYRLHQQMDQLFNETLNQVPVADAAILSAVSSPNLDVREEKDRYTVRVDMSAEDFASSSRSSERRAIV